MKTDRRYADLAAREARDRLRTETGDAEADRPSERSVGDIRNRMGYRRVRVLKGRPRTKAPDAGALFANVAAVRTEAADAPAVPEISMDTKAKVAEGAYARGGNPDRG